MLLKRYERANRNATAERAGLTGALGRLGFPKTQVKCQVSFMFAGLGGTSSLTAAQRKSFTATGVCKCDSSPHRRLNQVWPARVAEQETQSVLQRRRTGDQSLRLRMAPGDAAVVPAPVKNRVPEA